MKSISGNILMCCVVLSQANLVLKLVPPVQSEQDERHHVEAILAEESKIPQMQERQLTSLFESPSFVKAAQSSNVDAQIASLAQKIPNAGNERTAILEELINLSKDKSAKKAMQTAGVLQHCTSIMKSESAPASLKSLAGSLITLMTDLPVSSIVSDVATGSSGHVVVVLPSPKRLYGAHGSFLKDLAAKEAKEVHKLQQDVYEKHSEMVKILSNAGTSAGLERAANGCNYFRLGAQEAYDKVNTIVNRFGKVVAKSCGCVMVGQAAACSLAAIPETCGFPYQAYSALYGSSQQLWEVVKATTAKCNLIGHPSLGYVQ
jgi:hypothetical protein